MSTFSGTTQKCKTREKTVYWVEQLSSNIVVYHKACFRCHHCKGTLKLSNYSSLEGVLYCNPLSSIVQDDRKAWRKASKVHRKPSSTDQADQVKRNFSQLDKNARVEEEAAKAEESNQFSLHKNLSLSITRSLQQSPAGS